MGPGATFGLMVLVISAITAGSSARDDQVLDQQGEDAGESISTLKIPNAVSSGDKFDSTTATDRAFGLRQTTGALGEKLRSAVKSREHGDTESRTMPSTPSSRVNSTMDAQTSVADLQSPTQGAATRKRAGKINAAERDDTARSQSPTFEQLTTVGNEELDEDSKVEIEPIQRLPEAITKLETKRGSEDVEEEGKAKRTQRKSRESMSPSKEDTLVKLSDKEDSDNDDSDNDDSDNDDSDNEESKRKASKRKASKKEGSLSAWAIPFMGRLP